MVTRYRRQRGVIAREIVMLNWIRIWWCALLCLVLAALPALAGNNSGAAFSIWPDTGQTKCYNDTVEISCPPAGAAFYGQDAQYNGPARSYTVLGGGAMVQDNVTGLVWEQKTNKDGTANYSNPHDADNKYTWCDTNPNTNGGDAGTCGGHDTKDFIDRLNSTNFGGQDDWRLPTMKELATLPDLGRHHPAIDQVFAATINSYTFYWSSTSVVGRGGAHGVGFDFGTNEDGFSKEFSWNMRAVRGGHIVSAINRFINNGDTITDTVTGLEWQKATMGPMTWKAALAAAEDLTLVGKSDWRLPDTNELRSIVDDSRSDPAIDPVFAATTYSDYYWSSTSFSDNPYYAGNIQFETGTDVPDPKYYISYVRAVRGRQGGQTNQKLSFPLRGYTPQTVPISSIFDHSMISPYTENKVVTSYTGETGNKSTLGGDCDCYNKVGGKPFSINGNYTGASSCGGSSYLCYDGHPGIDFPIPNATPIYAVADGIAHIPVSFPGVRSAQTFNTVEIDHQNGYKTYYLHLNRKRVTEGQPVYKGQTIIGDSGAIGSPGAYHLHFEVQYNGIPVDPYGWRGVADDDPYTAATNVNLWDDSSSILKLLIPVIMSKQVRANSE